MLEHEELPSMLAASPLPFAAWTGSGYDVTAFELLAHKHTLSASAMLETIHGGRPSILLMILTLNASLADRVSVTMQ